ncbi:MAG TPA: pyrrolo-quinoline quinone [Planctomycetaceae bacterium]|nr:pyrrolo-quinoline quinone [Blastopirellula sp.]HAY82313.1 pyrrolo-quinoline quinone [Planctomycetaceae bacterium]
MPRDLLLVSFAALALSTSSASGEHHWPQFRGPRASGIGSGHPPTHWDVTTGEHVAWKTAIAGLGHSAPIVWGDRVYLTTAVNAEAEHPEVATGWSGGSGESAVDTGSWTWQVWCLHLNTGRVLWKRDAHSGKPQIQRHLKASHANCTPVTNGKFIVAFFGSEGLYCYDREGQLVWQRDLGKLHSGPYDAVELEWGFASSPILHEDRVIVQCDCLNVHFVAVLDLRTGKEILRIPRPGEVATWSTPTVISTGKRRQIVCNGFHNMAGYDLDTGSRLWHLSGGGDVPVPTPLFANGLIYITNGHGRSPTFAIHPHATGDLTPLALAPLPSESPQPPPETQPTDDANPPQPQDSPALAWWQARDGAYMPTPLIKDKLLYTCNDNGRLTVRNALNGDLIYRQRIGKGGRNYSASAVAAGGHVFFVSERGEVTVIKEGRQFEEVAVNHLDEIVMATPAIAGDRLLIRGVRHLYCLAP